MNPSRRLLSLLSRVVWQLTVVFFILVAVVVALGRELAPLADSYRPTILSVVNEIVGIPLDANQVGVRWKGIIPAIEVKNAKVSGLEGKRSLTLGKLVVDINPWLSLWHWKPVLYRLQIIEPQVYLEKDESNRWQISGIPHKAKGNKVSLASVIDAMLYSHLVELRNAHFIFQSKSGVSRRVFTPRIGIDNMKNFHRLTAVVGFENAGSVKVLLEGKGDHNRKGGMALSGYFNSDSLDVAVLARMLGYEWHSERSSIIDLSLWMESPNSSEIELKGQINLDHFSGYKSKDGKQIVPALNGFSAQLNGLGRYDEGWRISLSKIVGDLSGERFPFEQLAFRGAWGRDLSKEGMEEKNNSIRSVKPEISIGLGDFQASDILKMKLLDKYLPEKTQAILQGVSPDAQIANAWVDVYGNTESPFFIRGNFFNGQVNSWKGVPKVSRGHGYFEVEKFSGRAILHSQNGFDIAFPAVFEKNSEYTNANGELRWALYPDENYFTLYSGPVTIKGDVGIISGDFALFEPINRRLESAIGSSLFLSLGIREGNTENIEDFLPKAIKPKLKTWLLSAVKEGQVTSGSVIYRGSVKKEAASHLRTLQMGFDVAGTRLEYDSEWPALEKIDGLVLIDDKQFSGMVQNAELYESHLSDIQFRSKGELDKLALNIQGRAQTTIIDSLKLLRETPLQKTIGEAFNPWGGNGKLAVSLDLDIPLYKDAKMGSYQQKLGVTFSGASLSLAGQNLQFDQLQGTVKYDSEEGLSSPWLKAKLWDSNVEATITNSNKNFAQLEAVTSLSVNSLNQWLRQPLLTFFRGDSEFSASLTLPRANKKPETAFPELLITSRLGGIEVELPEPFGKKASELASLSVSLPLIDDVSGDGLRSIHVDFNQEAKGVLFFNQNSFTGAHIALGGVALPSLTSRALVAVNASLGRLDFLQWQELLDSYTTAESLMNEGLGGALKNTKNTPVDWLINAELDQFVMREFVVDGMTLLGKKKVRGGAHDALWEFDFNSDLLTGAVSWDVARSYPFEFDFQTVRFPEEKTNSEARLNDSGDDLNSDFSSVADPLKNIDLSSLPAARVNIQSVYVGEEDYGSWNFFLKPEGHQVKFHHLTARVKAITLGDPDWEKKLFSQANEKALKDRKNKAIELVGEDVSLEQLLESDEFSSLSLPEVIWISNEEGVHSVFKGDFFTKNIGDVAQAWGQDEIIKSKYGEFYANVSWPGSPLNFDLYQLEGDMNITLKRGQFLQDKSEVENPMLRLMGLFNFDSWARRLRLDFSDLYKSGMSYDRMRADLDLNDGVITLATPLEVDTPSSELAMVGVIDMNKETLDAEMTATLPVGGNLAMIGAIAGGLPAAIGVYVVSKIFKKQVKKVASVHYRIEGEWDDPKVEYMKLEEKKNLREESSSNTEAPEHTVKDSLSGSDLETERK